MDWAASAIKPGRQSLNRTSTEGDVPGVAIFQTGTGASQGVIVYPVANIRTAESPSSVQSPKTQKA